MPRMETLGIRTVGWSEVLAVACMVAAGRTSSDNLCYTRLIYTGISLSYPWDGTLDRCPSTKFGISRQLACCSRSMILRGG